MLGPCHLPRTLIYGVKGAAMWAQNPSPLFQIGNRSTEFRSGQAAKYFRDPVKAIVASRNRRGDLEKAFWPEDVECPAAGRFGLAAHLKFTNH